MTNIVLIGMSGAGKSTLGVLLAKAMNKNFVDTDLFIQRKYNLKLEEIISRQGIQVFKEYEEDVITSLSVEHAIIATGGSVVYSAKSMEYLSTLGIIVFLDVEFTYLEQRIADIKSRGIVIEPGQTLFELYSQRHPLYQSYADITVSILDESIEQTVQSIIDALKMQQETNDISS